MNWYWIGEPILYSASYLVRGIIVPRVHTEIKLPAKLLIIASRSRNLFVSTGSQDCPLLLR